jgi:ribose-phosphate pyrophosphokinase
MKILNLVYPEKSDIKYKISKFPDGQQNIVVQPWIENGFKPIDEGDYLVYHEIQIKSRLNNWLDLELIVASVASLRKLGVETIHLSTPYIIGARSDRQFEEGGNNYLKDVICPIINSLGFKTVTVLDPHSYVLEACLNNFKSVNNHGLVGYALDDLKYDRGSDKFILVSPDVGASKKIYKLAEEIGYKGDIITCNKERDAEGKLTRINVPFNTIVNKDYFLIDDICDGGRTFMNIAQVIKPRLHSSNKLFLIITHGVFSGDALRLLNDNFNGVYCTNSYSDIENLLGGVYTKNFKQLNVF